MTRFVKLVMILIVILLLFLISSYEVKQWGESELNQTIKLLLKNDPAIQSITYQDFNTNVFSALQGRWILTDVVITPKENPEYQLVLGRLSLDQIHIEHGILESFKLKVEDVFIQHLGKPVIFIQDFEPRLYLTFSYQRDWHVLVIKMAIFDQLENLQTRAYLFKPVTLDRPIPVSLKNNPWIFSWVKTKPVKVNITNNPKLTRVEGLKKIGEIDEVFKKIQGSKNYQKWVGYLNN